MENRPIELYGRTIRKKTACGNFFVTLNRDSEGKLVEVFCKLGKTGNCAAAYSEALARMIAVALAYGAEVSEVVDHLRGIRCDRQWGLGAQQVLSCPDALALILEEEKENQ